MGELLGLDTGASIPKIELAGFFSSTWVWVAIVAAVGVVLIIIAIVILYFMTYKKRVEFYENIGGRGYQRVVTTRAKIIKASDTGGAELLKTLRGGILLSAHGRKMGINTYWFAKGQDGYWYNIVLGDLDTKQGMLDIEPIDRDVSMFHVALDRLSHSTYGKQSFFEKYAIHMLLFAFLIVMILGMWFIVGKIGDATAPLAQSADLNERVTENTESILNRLESLVNAMNRYEGGSSAPPPTPLNDTGVT